MSRTTRRLLLALALALACLQAGPARADGSMRCSGGLVSVGDSKLDLLGKCGSPTLVEERLEERGTAVADREQRGGWKVRVTVSVEKWTYNFGTNQFVQYVTLDTGKIVAIERGGYGYALAASPGPTQAVPRARCEPSGFHEGDTTFDLLARCGPPATRDARLEKEAASSSPDGGQQVVTSSRTVTVEVWTYDFGRRSFVRHLTFVDGKLVKVETGSYGYAP
jgi:hypothetical protein